MVSRDTRETPFKMLQKKTGDFSHFEKVKSRTCLTGSMIINGRKDVNFSE